MWFTRISISNPVFATMMMAALLVLGAFSYSRLPVEQFPDVRFPVNHWCSGYENTRETGRSTAMQHAATRLAEGGLTA